MPGFDALNRQCRTLEAQLDGKMAAYARLGAALARSGDTESTGAPSRHADVAREVEDLLTQLRDANNSLDALASDAAAPPPPAMARAIERHADVLRDYDREFARTRENVQAALDRESLLSGVRNDIDAYKSSAADSLLAERGRIDSSHRMVDDVLEQAHATRHEFGMQSATLRGINVRMTSVLNTMPGINNLLGMIKTRRRRDAIIMGLVIGVCMLLLLSYVF